jgi:hypothetical protein
LKVPTIDSEISVPAFNQPVHVPKLSDPKLNLLHEEELTGLSLSLSLSEAEAEAAQPEETEEVQYPFFTEADFPDDLLNARLDIALYSLARAKNRVERAKRRKDDPDEDLEKEAELAVEQAQEFVLDCSEIGDARPLSGCSFSKDGNYLATRYVSYIDFVDKTIFPV